MDGQWCVVLAALLACLATASAADYQLSCFFNEKICEQWKDNKNASQGNYNDLKFCCPPEQDQGLRLTGFPPNENSCKCKKGSAADWAHLLNLTTTAAPVSPGGDGNAASVVTPYHQLAVMILMIVAVILY